MADKTALNTGYELFANIVFACGFADATGNFTELVSDTAIGVPGGTSQSRGTDPTYGEFWSGESDDSNVNFGDNAAWDGTSQLGVHAWAHNDASEIPGGAGDSQRLFSKEGSGADSFAYTWLNSENIIGYIGTGGQPYPQITDGLTDTNWHHFGIDYDGSNSVIRVDGTTASGSDSGSVNATAHDVLVGNGTGLANGWLGNIAAFVIFDVGLSTAQNADLTADFINEIFAADAGGAGGFPFHRNNSQRILKLGDWYNG